MTMEDGLGSQTRKILFRDKELNLLRQYMGPPSSVPYSCLFIYGHSSTGKTLAVSLLLQETKVPYVWIDCHEACCSLSVLFTSITKQTSKVVGLDDPNAQCGNVCDLVIFLKSALKDLEETCYFVFDNMETLKSKYTLLLPTLACLQELTGINLATIFISDVISEHFRSNHDLFNPICIHFPHYSKENMVDILCLDCPSNFERSLYESYANIIMKIFHIVTRDLNELRHIAQLNFDRYCEPIMSGEVAETNVLKLFRNIEPTLKEAIHAVYLREVSALKWNLFLKSGKDRKTVTVSSKFHMMKELPFYSKLLLIASYFASYNSPKTDYRHFVKNQGKQPKKRITKRKMHKNRHLLGPKSFPLNRMMSIFFAIVGHAVLPSAVILSQLSSLCSLQLVSRISVEEQLDTPTYKCLAELDLVRNIGQTVNIDIMNYLDDFL